MSTGSSPAPAGGKRLSRGWQMAMLAGIGALLNTQPIPLFYGIHLLLGSIPAVLAVLLWRTPWAILIGAIASLSTWPLWGHPWAIVIFSLEIGWLTLCSRRWNGPRINDGNGRILLFSIGYWLLIGSPLVALFYGLVMKIDPANTAVVAVKQSFNGILNTAIAFGLFLALQSQQAKRERGHGISLRGTIMVFTLSAILIPTLLVSALSGDRIETLSQQSVLDRLKAANTSIAQIARPAETSNSNTKIPGIDSEIDYQILAGNGRKISSDPQLFNRINSQFTEGGRRYLKSKELSILIPRGTGPILKKWVNGYWSYSRQYSTRPADHAGGGFVVQVVYPARSVVVRVQRQSSELLGTALVLLLVGAWISDRAGAGIAREFDQVIAPLRRKNNQLEPLQLSPILEIKQLSLMINHRLRQVNQLSADLRRSNHQLKASQIALEELLTRDKLTGCGTAKALEQRLIEEWHRSQRTKDPFCCLWINLDGFRTTNALVGSDIGNSILRCVASALEKRLRITDHLYRWEADQFVVIATGCYPEDGCRLARMLQQTIEEIYLEAQGSPQTGSGSDPRDHGTAPVPAQGEIRLSATVGVSCSSGSYRKAQELLDAARSSVGSARSHGPGQLALAPEPPQQTPPPRQTP